MRLTRRDVLAVAILAIVLLPGAALHGFSAGAARWTASEREVLRSLWIGSLGELRPDPSNRYAEDSLAADLGHRLFFDARFSSTGAVSCASCHVPERQFQDGLALAEGVGRTARRTMPIAGTAHSPWQFWDGRADSQWAQALGPLESAVEHGGDRTQYAHLVAAAYREPYEALFGRLPELDGLPPQAGPVADSGRASAWRRIAPARQEDITRVYANIGKAIAAYERRISYAPSRFDRYVEAELAGREHTAEDALTSDEAAGLRLFIGKASCVNCHNGPLFTDDHFHNTGIAVVPGLPPDSGRAAGAGQALSAEFSCTSRWSDAGPDDAGPDDAGPDGCAELRFAVTEGEELVRAFKTPSLRNVVGRAPYMHAGQLATLEAVVEHYDRAPAAPFGHSELRRLRLSAAERRQVTAFLGTLSGPLSAPPGWLEPPAPPRR